MVRAAIGLNATSAVFQYGDIRNEPGHLLHLKGIAVIAQGALFGLTWQRQWRCSA